MLSKNPVNVTAFAAKDNIESLFTRLGSFYAILRYNFVYPFNTTYGALWLRHLKLLLND